MPTEEPLKASLKEIGERKQADDALRASDERFRQLAENIHEVFWLIDVVKQKVIYVSPAYEDIWGRTCASLYASSTPWPDSVHPDDLARVRHVVTTNLATGIYDEEFRIVRPDNSIRWIRERAFPVRNAAGEVYRMAGVAKDITEQKRAEEQTGRLVERLTTTLESITDAFFTVDQEWRFTFLNREAERLLGRTRAELTGRDFWTEFPDTIGSTFEREYRRAMADNKTVDFEEFYPPLDTWFGVRAYPSAQGLAVYFRDITERKQAEAALRTSEERFKTMFVQAPLGIALIDSLTGHICEANPRFAEIAGRSMEEIPNIDWIQITHPDDVQTDLDNMALLNAGKINGFQMEKRYLHPDGTAVWIDMTIAPLQVEDKAQPRHLCMVQDITARKRSLEALRASEKRFKTLFEQAAVGVVQTDVVTGRFVQINQRFCEIMGRNRQELEQLTFVEITHPQDVGSGLEMMRQLKAGAIREFTQEKRYVRKDHSEVWANVTVSAMWMPGETPDYSIAIVQDVTGRKRLEEQFRQTQKMEAIGTLAGGIAHDFNNILAAINGYTELSKMKLTANPEVREYLGAVLQASGRATDLVRQILAFSRQQRPERRLIQLRPVVAESLKLLRAIIPSTIEFDTSLATDAPTVLADVTQIHQILMNLGTNAWHAMKDRIGRLQVKLERYVVDEAHAATQPRLRPGVYARVSVSDTGCGMDQATLRRIFEPFFTTKAPGEGTGLGLSVVHGIMETHDGAVTVDSQSGEGTVFHLYFPAHAGEATVPAAEEGTVPRGHGDRVLFVDDEELLVRLGEKTLTALGYEVEVATQPVAALAMVRADPQRFALVITDQTMPGMTGLMLANQLRQIRPELPVILMTGYGLSLTPERLKEAGIRQLLLKPTAIHSLGAAVHAALSAHLPQ